MKSDGSIIHTNKVKLEHPVEYYYAINVHNFAIGLQIVLVQVKNHHSIKIRSLGTKVQNRGFVKIEVLKISAGLESLLYV